MIFLHSFIVSFLFCLSIARIGVLVLANTEKCGDISIYRSDNVINNFNPDMAVGRWFEVAYHDLAQVKEKCQYYDRTKATTSEETGLSTGFSESFHFQYPSQPTGGSFKLFYSPTNTTGRIVDIEYIYIYIYINNIT